MIHQFQQNGLSVVLDVASGSIHVVDDIAYDMISLYETTPPEELVALIAQRHGIDRAEARECLEDIVTLRREGKLFSEEKYTPDVTSFKARNQVIKALCLHVSHACNLSCSYCFAAQGKFHGESALMSFEVGKRALDFLIENSGTRHNLEVDFFGGEPLLNWDVVKKLVGYARSREEETGKHFRFTLTTNGVLIDDDVIDFTNREMDNVVLSLDGRKEIHDHFRKDWVGKGSYDDIVPRFHKLVESRGDREYYMRGTFTHNNPDFTEDILHMADLGFTRLSMEPVVCAPDDPYALTEEDKPVVLEQYELLGREMLRRDREGRGFVFYHYMLDLAHGPCIYKRVAGCGSGTEYFAVTPAGDLYPCHQFVGDPAYRMGDVWNGVTNTQKQEKFRDCNLYSREECKSCWARLYCSGGCAANAYHATGDINGIYEYGCDLFRKRIECAIALQLSEKYAGGESESKQ